MICSYHACGMIFFQGSHWSVLVGFVWSLSSDHRQVSWPHPPSGEYSYRASPAGHSAPGKTQLSNTGILEIFMLQSQSRGGENSSVQIDSAHYQPVPGPSSIYGKT